MKLKKLVWQISLMVFCFSCSNNPEVEKEIEETEAVIGPENASIALVRHKSKDMTYTYLTTPNHIAYARQHGYSYIGRNGNIAGDRFLDLSNNRKVLQLGLYWQKIVAMQDALAQKTSDGKLPKYKWAMWIDADIVFTNMNIKVEHVIEKYGKGKDFIVAKDVDIKRIPMNSGVFLVKNTEAGRKILSDWAAQYDAYKNADWPDQQALHDLVFNMPPHPTQPIYPISQFDVSTLKPEVALVHQRVMNSFFPGNYWPYDLDLTPQEKEEVNWGACDYIAHVAGPQKESRLQQLSIEVGKQGNCPSKPF